MSSDSSAFLIKVFAPQELTPAILGHTVSASVGAGVVAYSHGFSGSVPLWAAIGMMLLGALLSVAVFHVRARMRKRLSLPRTKHLSQTQWYPIRVRDGEIHPDSQVLKNGIAHFKDQPVTDESFEFCSLAKALGNGEWKLTDSADIEALEKLKRRHGRYERPDREAVKTQLFSMLTEIVQGIGQTIGSKNIEIVLHDIRNPFHSIQTVCNPITGRRAQDKLTDFGIRLIKAYDGGNLKGNQLNYPVQGQDIKGSTIPLWTKELGLFGFICVNINRQALDGKELLDRIGYIDPASHVKEVIR